MNIKRLEIFGFKSFKNKTVFEFDRNLTGIVGPNGCGKSNIVDALIWVMGEASVKILRGESFEDVIFSGTKSHEPGSFAEVSLLLEKGPKGFPEKYKDFSELTISRRLERGGESQYFINRAPCRMKDIKEIFMDTGAGCRGFSIIEQEAIEKLITAKPRQRRLIIEEVAGITKFRSRKTESLRKLDKVQENLKRLNDILKTQDAQLKSLSRQVKSAEKFKNLKKEIRDKEKELCYRLLEAIESDREKLEDCLSCCRKDQSALESKKQELQSRFGLMEKDIKNEEDLLDKERKYLSDLEFKIVERRKEAEKIEAAIQLYGDNLKNQSESMNTIEKDVQAAKEKIKGIEIRLKSLKQKESKKKDQLKLLDESFSQLEHLPDLKVRKEELDSERQQHKSERDEWAVRIGILESRQQFLSGENEKTLLNTQEMDLKIRKVLKEKSEKTARLKQYRQIKIQLEKDISDLESHIKNHQKKHRSLEEKIIEAQQKVFVLSHKIKESQKLVNHFESPNEGNVSLLQWKPEAFQPLIKNITVEPGFEDALEAALGTHLYALFSESEKSIQEGIDYLKQSQKGKAGFLLPLEEGERVPEEDRRKIESFPAFVCFLDDKVNFSLKTKTLLRLAARTVVVSNFYSALELAKLFLGFQFVTKEGDFISRDHLIYGGSNENKTHIFKIKRETEEFLKALHNKETHLAYIQNELKQEDRLLKEALSQQESFLRKQGEIESLMRTLEREEQILEREVLSLTERKESLEKQQSRFSSEQNQLSREIKNVDKNLKNEERLLKTKVHILNNLQERIDRLENFKLQKQELEMELFSLQKESEIADQETGFIRDFLSQCEDKRAGFLKIEKRLKDSFSDQKRQLREIQKECHLHSQEKEGLEGRFKLKENDLKRKQENSKKVLQSIEETQRMWESKKAEIYEILLKKEKQDLQQQNIKEKLLKEYQVNAEGSLFVPKYKDLSSEQLQEDLDLLRQRLSDTGEVNLIALKDYESLLKDNLFLAEQREDLLNSKKELLKIISHVDKLCHKRFSARLDEINFRFSRIFPIVFEGDGEASLVLKKSEEDDLAGVDIMVRPPGKSLQGVNLLSRGEKALTAICLVYSLFLVKPSPFCVLDEVDASLDDANNFRFLSVLKQMARQSRIIAVTHNKRTMQVCNHLYGVTMRQPGVSQVVSVDLSSGDRIQPS